MQPVFHTLPKTCFLLLALLAAGCSTLTQPSSTSPLADETSAPPPAVYYSTETLYDLLVAEIAMDRGRLDITLGNYVRQAHFTHHPDIIAQAARIARYLQASQAALDVALLWSKVEPDNPEALQIAAIQLLQEHRYEEAMYYIDRILQSPQRDEVNFDFFVQNSRLLKKKHRKTVTSALHDLAEKYPTHQKLWLALAQLQELNGDTDAALTSVSHVIKQNRRNLDARLLEIRLLNNSDRKRALKKLASTVRAFPDSKRARLQYTLALLSQKQFKAADRQSNKLLKRFPDDGDLVMSLALIAWEGGNNAKAIALLQRLLDLDHRADEAHLYLGQIAATNGQFDQAINHYTAIQPGENYLAAQIQIGMIMAQQGQPQDALFHMRSLRGRYPEQADHIYAAEMQILMKEEEYQQAYDLLSEALTAFPDNPTLLYDRAMIADKLNRIDLLEADLLSMLAINPDNPDALNALGYTLADKTDRLQEAYQYIKRAVDLEPNEPAYVDSLGWVYFRMGNLDNAIKYLQRAFSLFPDPEIAAHLGEALWRNGEQEKARHLLQSVLEKHPDSQPLKATIDRLAK